MLHRCDGPRARRKPLDLTTVTSLIGSIRTAGELARAIKDSGVTLVQAETKLKLADLVSALADVKTQAAAVRQELLDAQERIRELEAAANLRAELVWRQPVCVRKTESGEEEAYCQPCRDKGEQDAMVRSLRGHIAPLF